MVTDVVEQTQLLLHGLASSAAAAAGAASSSTLLSLAPSSAFFVFHKTRSVQYSVLKTHKKMQPVRIEMVFKGKTIWTENSTTFLHTNQHFDSQDPNFDHRAL